ncbi:MAG: YdjY domain-containing protein [Planctomycetes bacterium]|nr:YdjY domain-containing protein [Planctomycetota bacterium]
MAENRFRVMDGVIVALLGAVGVVGLLARSSSEEARRAAVQALAEARTLAGSAEAARAAAEKAAAGGDLRADFDLLASNLGDVQRQIKEIADQQNFGGNPFGFQPGQDPGGLDAPPGQPVLEFTPELVESLRKAVAAKGIVLGEDRVTIPGRTILRQGAIEFFAVFPGGKAHEAIFSLTGTPDEEGNPPSGLGASLNSCLMALGLRPGTPIRLLPGGRTIPAKGSPVHLSVEWEEEGKVVRVRAEDLLWDRERNRSMDSGKWIYVGSFFDPEGYVPDLTGDAVACYSVPTCVIDLDDPRAANDQIFIACGPRIPADGTPVRLILSRTPLEPTRAWDPEEPSRVTLGDPPKAPPEEGTGGGK